VLAALSTGHKIGLLAMAGAFILFSLAVAFLIPRYRPDFPGRRGLKWFLLVTVLLFAGMLTAVEIFGVEPKESAAEAASGETDTSKAPGTEVSPTAPATTSSGTPVFQLAVKETEWKIALPTSKTLQRGTYDIALSNDGKVPHDLVISGPGVDNQATPVIAAGKQAKLQIALGPGTYEFYCNVPGHKDLGMDLKVQVN
jgi:plastocyanin